MAPLASVTWVLGIGALEVGVFAASRKKLSLATFRQHPVFFLTVGLLVGVSATINYTAIHYIEPGVASLLSEMSIVFGVALGLFWLKERLCRLPVSIHALIFTLSPVAWTLFGSRPTAREWFGGGIVLVGGALITSRKR